MRIRRQPRRRPQVKRPPSKLNIDLFSLTANHLHFRNELSRQPANLPVSAAAAAAAMEEKASVEDRWCQLRNTVWSTAPAVLSRLASFFTGLDNHLEQGLQSESQCGFRRHRGTTNMILVAYQLQKCQDMRINFYYTSMDLKKAFARVNLKEMWKIMRKSGCPERFTHVVCQLNDGMMA
nr:unnamed protein product [Spirometra erinaceieuropaei]